MRSVDPLHRMGFWRVFALYEGTDGIKIPVHVDDGFSRRWPSHLDPVATTTSRKGSNVACRCASRPCVWEAVVLSTTRVSASAASAPAHSGCPALLLRCSECLLPVLHASSVHSCACMPGRPLALQQPPSWPLITGQPLGPGAVSPQSSCFTLSRAAVVTTRRHLVQAAPAESRSRSAAGCCKDC